MYFVMILTESLSKIIRAEGEMMNEGMK